MGKYSKQIEELREKGLLGSTSDPFWNPDKGIHECCGSPRSYYHRDGCPACSDGWDGKPALTIPKLKAGAWRISEDQAKTMYELYTHGAGDGIPMSLAEIGKAYRKSRQAVYDIFHSRGWPLRSKPRKGLTIRYGINFTYDGHGVLRGTKEGRRVYLHRMIWEEANGPVPETHVVRVKDGNYTNMVPENLELVPKKMMAIVFNPERKRDDRKAWLSRRAKTKRSRKPDLDMAEDDEEIYDMSL